MDSVTLVQLLTKKGLTITTAESCTGGLIAAAITDVPGASTVFHEGFISYSNDAKIKRLSVLADSLAEYGAVSEQVAKEMAVRAQKVAGADLAISVTGIAGPGGGSADKPVGTVWIGLSYDGDVMAQRFLFEGNREDVRLQVVETAFKLVVNSIDKFLESPTSSSS